MSVFRQTDDGDIYRPAGAKTFERVNGVEETRYHMRSRLRILRREVFSDERIGLAFFELISNPRVDSGAVANHITSIVLATPGVVEAELSFEYEPLRGELIVEGEVVYDAQDQRDRRPAHERVQIFRSGGSVTQ